MIEPMPIKAGDKRLLLNGKRPLVDCRVIAEQNYQDLVDIKQQIVELINEQIKHEKIIYSNILKKINSRTAGTNDRKKFGSSLYCANRLLAILTKIGEL